MRYLLALSVLSLAACDPSSTAKVDSGDTIEDATTTSDFDGGSDADTGTEEGDDTGSEAGETSPADTLQFMREEEKLARDVYLYLDARWGRPKVFANISDSEQQHMDALLVELDRLGLEDPVTDDTLGVFANDTLAALYVDLTTAGDSSVEDALAVGALIEDLDIVDLQTAAAETDDATLIATYARLECGSRNHLRAFTDQLTDRGIDYEPQFLSLDAYEAILAGDQERCD